jgi:hypothetical protein
MMTSRQLQAQPAADMPLKLCDATLNGRLIDAVIPSKIHSCNMQLCEPHLQSCDWRGACSIVGDGPKAYNIRLGTLRQRYELVPRRQIFGRSQQAWVNDLNAIPQFEKMPPPR